MLNTNQNKYSLPHFVGEHLFSIELEDGKEIRFTELRIIQEDVTARPVNKQNGIIYQNIITQSGKERLEEIDLEAVEAFSLNCEYVQAQYSILKIITRVVLVTDKGQRVLDTLVAPQQLPDNGKAAIKEGFKTKLFQLAESKGPELSEVMNAIKYLVKGKKLVGYHLPMKLQDLGIMNEFLQEAKLRNKTKKDDSQLQTFSNGLSVSNIHDIAKLFNRDPKSQTQIPFGSLCQNELNLNYMKRGYPNNFIEAKISMALYLQWKDLKNGESVKLEEDSDKENENPALNSQISQKEVTHNFQDKNLSLKIESAAMIRFLIKEAVQEQFKIQMAQKFKSMVK